VVRCDPDTTTTLFGDGFPGTGVRGCLRLPETMLKSVRSRQGGK